MTAPSVIIADSVVINKALFFASYFVVLYDNLLSENNFLLWNTPGSDDAVTVALS